jgi:hypothetical protein
MIDMIIMIKADRIFNRTGIPGWPALASRGTGVVQ